MELNIVSCGNCGKVFAHELPVEELTCPYCKWASDISDFPDLYYPPEHNDSLIDIDKEKKAEKLEQVLGDLISHIQKNAETGRVKFTDSWIPYQVARIDDTLYDLIQKGVEALLKKTITRITRLP